MGIHCLLPFLRKLKSVCGPARLLLSLRDKFVVRRQLKRFRKNRNCGLSQESIHLAAVTLTADGCVNNIKTGNRRLTCQCIILQRDSDLVTHEIFIHLIFCGRDRKKKIARTNGNITLCNTISSGFAKPQERTDGEMTP